MRRADPWHMSLMWDLSGSMLACANSKSVGVVLSTPVAISAAFLWTASIFRIAAFIPAFFLVFGGEADCGHHTSAAYSILGMATL